LFGSRRRGAGVGGPLRVPAQRGTRRPWREYRGQRPGKPVDPRGRGLRLGGRGAGLRLLEQWLRAREAMWPLHADGLARHAAGRLRAPDLPGQLALRSSVSFVGLLGLRLRAARQLRGPQTLLTAGAFSHPTRVVSVSFQGGTMLFRKLFRLLVLGGVMV